MVGCVDDNLGGKDDLVLKGEVDLGNVAAEGSLGSDKGVSERIQELQFLELAESSRNDKQFENGGFVASALGCDPLAGCGTHNRKSFISQLDRTLDILDWTLGLDTDTIH